MVLERPSCRVTCRNHARFRLLTVDEKRFIFCTSFKETVRQWTESRRKFAVAMMKSIVLEPSLNWQICMCQISQTGNQDFACLRTERRSIYWYSVPSGKISFLAGWSRHFTFCAYDTTAQQGTFSLQLESNIRLVLSGNLLRLTGVCERPLVSFGLGGCRLWRGTSSVERYVVY